MYKLPPLPYALDALTPIISKRTVTEHYSEHHLSYIRAANELARVEGLHGLDLGDLVITASSAVPRALYNNAAQAWNHAFYWQSMTPGASGPSPSLAKRIERQYGGLASLREVFVRIGTEFFGAGWLWLTSRNGRLVVMTTRDAANLLMRPEMKPMLVCDLWEHAYYLDYKSRRGEYLEMWFDRLANWDFAESQLTMFEADAPGPFAA